MKKTLALGYLKYGMERCAIFEYESKSVYLCIMYVDMKVCVVLYCIVCLYVWT